MPTTTTSDPAGVWSNISSAPGTGWASITTSPDTSYSTIITVPGSNWQLSGLLYFNINSHQIWGDLDFIWGTADDT